MPLTGAEKAEANRKDYLRRKADAKQTHSDQTDSDQIQTSPVREPEHIQRYTKKNNKGAADKTLRRLMAAHAILDGKTPTVALRQAGLSPGTESARQAVQTYAQRALDKAGATPAHAAARLRESLDAKETKFFADKGKVTDEREVVAHGIRLDAVRETLKIHDAYPHDKPDPDRGQGPIVAIQFVSRQPVTEPTEQRVTAVLDFGKRETQ